MLKRYGSPGGGAMLTERKALPIMFSGPMVRAILEEKKTQTRRVIKLPHIPWASEKEWCFGECLWSLENANNYVAAFSKGSHIEIVKCPYGGPVEHPFGVPGGQLWVKEAYAAPHDCDHLKPREIPEGTRIHYAATEERGGLLWRSPRFMPRWASRITLQIAGIRVERLQDISEDDARAEGCDPVVHPDGAVDCGTRKTTFSRLWERINGAESLRSNPYVWVIDFRHTKQGVEP